MPRWRIGSAGIAALMAAAPAAGAEGDPVRLVYSAPAGCPSASEFGSQVRARTQRARDPEPGELPRTFRVRIDVQGSSFAGTLAIQESSGADAGRQLSGRNCAEVVEALALVVALAIDPRASTARETPPPIPQDAPEQELATPAHQVPDDLRPTPRPRPRLSAEGGVHAGAVQGLSPGPQLEVGVMLGLLSSRDGPLAPAVWVDWLHVPRRVHERPQGDAAFQAELGILDTCPFAAIARHRAELRACARLETGRISAAGERTPNPRRAEARWLAPGVSLRAAFSPFHPLWVGMTAAVAVPVARDRFLIGTDVIHELPAAAMRVGFTLTVRPW